LGRALEVRLTLFFPIIGGLRVFLAAMVRPVGCGGEMVW
jgi:hypothetical protein